MTRLYIIADDSMKGRQAGSAGIRRPLRTSQPSSNAWGSSLPATAARTSRTCRSCAATSTRARRSPPAPPRFAPTPTSSRSSFAARRAASTVRKSFTAAFSPIPPRGSSAEQARGKLVVFNPKLPPGTPPHFYTINIRPMSRFAGAAGVAIPTLELAPPEYLARVHRPGLALRRAPPAPKAHRRCISSSRSPLRRTLLGASPDSQARRAGQDDSRRRSSREKPRPARNVVAILPRQRSEARRASTSRSARTTITSASNDAPVDHDSMRAFNDGRAPRGRGRRRTRTPTPDSRRAQIRVIVDWLRKVHAPRARLDLQRRRRRWLRHRRRCSRSPRRSRGDAPSRSARSSSSGTPAKRRGCWGSRVLHRSPDRAARFDRRAAQHGHGRPRRRRDGRSSRRAAGPSYLQLVGSRRLSTELGDLVESGRTRTEHARLHVRLRAGRERPPAATSTAAATTTSTRATASRSSFFTTGGHRDYHQVTDEPQYIDYAHMARVANYVHDVAITVANLDHRVVVDKPKPDPKGAAGSGMKS